jgi:hypothetical protein
MESLYYLDSRAIAINFLDIKREGRTDGRTDGHRELCAVFEF